MTAQMVNGMLERRGSCGLQAGGLWLNSLTKRSRRMLPSCALASLTVCITVDNTALRDIEGDESQPLVPLSPLWHSRSTIVDDEEGIHQAEQFMLCMMSSQRRV